MHTAVTLDELANAGVGSSKGHVVDIGQDCRVRIGSCQWIPASRHPHLADRAVVAPDGAVAVPDPTLLIGVNKLFAGQQCFA